MQFRVEDEAPCVKTLVVEIAADELDSEFESAEREVQKAIRVPGFRPGRVPLELVRKRYADAIAGEVTEKVVRQAVEKQLGEHKWSLVKPAELVDDPPPLARRGAPLSFRLRLEIQPTIELPEYQGQALVAPSAEPLPEEIDRFVDELREQSATFQNVEGRPLERGDYAVATYEAVPKQELGAGSDATAARLLSGRSVWMAVEAANQAIPGLVDGMVGMSVGQTRRIPVAYSSDYRLPELRDRRLHYDVTLEAIKAKQLPGLTEEWAAAMGSASIEELRRRLADELRERKQRLRTRYLRDQALMSLIERTPFDIPPSIVEQETRNAVYDIVERTHQQGLEADQIRAHQDQIYQEAARGAELRARGNFILSQIADREKIEVSREEIAQVVGALARDRREEPTALLRKMRESGTLADIVWRLRAQKALDFVVANANVSDRMPS